MLAGESIVRLYVAHECYGAYRQPACRSAVRGPALRTSASGPDIGLQGPDCGWTATGKAPKLSLRPADGRPKGRFLCFPGSSPATIRPGRPISVPEAILRNIEYVRQRHYYRTYLERSRALMRWSSRGVAAPARLIAGIAFAREVLPSLRDAARLTLASWQRAVRPGPAAALQGADSKPWLRSSRDPPLPPEPARVSGAPPMLRSTRFGVRSKASDPCGPVGAPSKGVVF
jgi:hypothetical protein